jgi:hypothetical protein
VTDPSTGHEEAVPPDTMRGDVVSNIFPSCLKKELNLESLSLTVVSEDSTSDFHVLNDLSKFSTASSNTTTCSSRYYVMVDSSVMRSRPSSPSASTGAHHGLPSSIPRGTTSCSAA